MIIYILAGVFAIVVLYYLSRGAIYLPTHQTALARMLELANPRPGIKVADLGSGDGRIVIAFAERGCVVTGFELNPILSFWSKLKIRKLKLEERARIKTSDFWFENLAEYDVVIVFGMTHIMEKLSKKFLAEARDDAVIISNIFVLPGLKKVSELGGVRMYKKLTGYESTKENEITN